MRFRLRYSLATFLLLPLAAGIGIKIYCGPHEFSLLDELEKLGAERAARDPMARYIVYRPRSGTFWAYRNIGGGLTRHGPEVSFGAWGDKRLIEYHHGKQHGAYRQWDVDGSLRCEGQCENDAPTGEWNFYSEGRIYRRVLYDSEAGHEVESTYHQGRQTERRIAIPARDEVQLIAWHQNGTQRLEGRLVHDQPDGHWTWWDSNGKRIRSAEFRGGVPLEFAGQPRLERLFACGIEVGFSEVPVQIWLDLFGASGIPIQAQPAGNDESDIRDRLITTVKDVKGPLAFYLALQDVGLKLDIRTDDGGREVLVVHPADAK
jgi:hypothetical protein